MSESTPAPGLLGHPHDDLEYAVGGVYTRDAALAIVLAVETALLAGDGVTVLDVIVWSEAGARAYGGDAAVAVYAEDPDASVHDRIVISAISQGRVA